jgi:hypothetical protein
MPCRHARGGGGHRCIPRIILNFGAKWGRVVNATIRPFCPPGKSPVTHCTAEWVGPRGSLDQSEERIETRTVQRGDILTTPSGPVAQNSDHDNYCLWDVTPCSLVDSYPQYSGRRRRQQVSPKRRN